MQGNDVRRMHGYTAWEIKPFLVKDVDRLFFHFINVNVAYFVLAMAIQYGSSVMPIKMFVLLADTVNY